MKTFSYRARTADGAQVKGRIEAESAPAAARALAAEGRVVVHLAERRVRLPQAALRLRGRVTEEERIALFQELAALLGAGLPVHEALAHLVGGADAGSPYGRLTAALHRAVLRGTALSQAMAGHADVFSPRIVGMVRAGEESGTLHVIFSEMAAFLTEEHTVRESVKSALAYPLFLLAATAFSVLLMAAFVLPVFSALLRDLGAAPPLPTRILLALSDAAAAHPYLLLVIPLLLAAACAALLRVDAVRFWLDECVLRVPILGRFIRFAEWGMILKTLAILMHSGIRLDRAVHLARFTAGNRVLIRSLERVEQSLIQGRTMTRALSHERQMPQLLQGMLAAGESAGDLEHLLRHAAAYCTRTAQQLSARMEALAEPVMIVVIAGVIFFAVLSFLLPVFEAMDTLM